MQWRQWPLVSYIQACILWIETAKVTRLPSISTYTYSKELAFQTLAFRTSPITYTHLFTFDMRNIGLKLTVKVVFFNCFCWLTLPLKKYVFSPSEGGARKRTGGGDAHFGHDAVWLDRLRRHEACGHLAVLQEERWGTSWELRATTETLATVVAFC